MHACDAKNARRGHGDHGGRTARPARSRSLGVVVFAVAVLAGSCGSSSLPSADRPVLQSAGGASEAPPAGAVSGFGLGSGIGADGTAGPFRPAATPEAPDAPSAPPVTIRSAVTLDRLAVVEPAATPTALRIESVGIDAPVRSVGIDPAGEFELPPGSEIGWYRFGPAPGADGSAVLAAHVDWNGRPGAFFELQETTIGDRVTVSYDDGSEASFVVVDVHRHAKSELPLDTVFERTGPPRLTLITCGGDFNPQLRSYEDNLVVIAEPAT